MLLVIRQLKCVHTGLKAMPFGLRPTKYGSFSVLCSFKHVVCATGICCWRRAHGWFPGSLAPPTAIPAEQRDAKLEGGAAGVQGEEHGAGDRVRDGPYGGHPHRPEADHDEAGRREGGACVSHLFRRACLSLALNFGSFVSGLLLCALGGVCTK